MSENKSYVELRHINKYYGDFQASKDVNLNIPRGKLVALLGPSGSGPLGDHDRRTVERRQKPSGRALPPECGY